MNVFLLWHIRKINDDRDDEKLIGVYSNEQLAKAAIERLLAKPGFSAYPDGFEIVKYRVNKDNWTDGFVSV